MQSNKLKSKVARFFPSYHYNYVIHDYPNDIGKKLKNNIVSIQLADPKFMAGWRLGSSESYALASRADQTPSWYCKSGCCEGISVFHAVGTIYYYVPNVGTLSKGKKIAYVAEVSKLLNAKIDFVESQLSVDGLSIPGSDILHKPEITSDTHGIYDRPKVWGDFKEWLVFRVDTTKKGQSLLVLQFLRALYTIVGVNVPHGDDLANKDRKSLYVNQPQMYFRLKRWFPKLSIQHLMMLSYCISGSDNISSTYYKWYFNPVNEPLDLKNFHSATGINNWLVEGSVKISMVRIAMDNYKPFTISNEEVLKRRPGSARESYVGGSGVGVYTVRDTGLGTNNAITVGGAADYMVGKAFSKVSKEGFKEAITLIAKFSGNEKLLKEIETQ
jgi:hypothetical protein